MSHSNSRHARAPHKAHLRPLHWKEDYMVFPRVSLLLNILKTRALWLLGMAACLLLAAAFQVPYTFHVDVGAPGDRFWIQSGMYKTEPNSDPTVRWTQSKAILLIPALTSGEWNLALRVNGWQPEGAPIVELRAGNAQFTHQTTGDWETWKQTVSLPAGDSRFELDTDTFRPADSGNNDARDLGVRFDTLDLAPRGKSLRVPPFFEYVLPLAAAVLLCFLNLSLLGLDSRLALFGSVGVLLGFLVLIVFGRGYLNSGWLVALLLILSGSLLFILFGLDAIGALFHQTGIKLSQRELNLLGLIVLGLVSVKLVGNFYPGISIIDAVFHLHRLEFVEAGNLFFVTRSREFASLETVYPPGLYLVLLPLGVLAPDDLDLLKFALPVIEAAGGLVLYWIARKNDMSMSGALCAVLLYLGAPIAFITLGWGVYSNLFAQFILVVLIALWFGLPWRTHPWRSAALFGSAMTLGFLAHASMLALLIVFWGAVIALTYMFRTVERRTALFTAAALGLALGLAFVLYFSAFVEKTASNLAALEVRGSGTGQEFERVVGGGLDDKGLGLVPLRVHSWLEWASQGALYLAREAWVYYRAVAVILTLGGLVWLWRDPHQRPLAILVSAGCVTVLLFFLIGLGVDLYTRYMLFGAPFFALGAGYMLARLWQGDWIRRAMVLASLALVLISSLGFWLTRVVT